MAIHVMTDDPQSLLVAIMAAVVKGKHHPHKEGAIRGWDIAPGGDLFPVTEDPKEAVWLRPEVKSGQLIFLPLHVEGRPSSQEALGHRLGQFGGMLVTHFPNHFECVMLFP